MPLKKYNIDHLKCRKYFFHIKYSKVKYKLFHVFNSINSISSLNTIGNQQANIVITPSYLNPKA